MRYIYKLFPKLNLIVVYYRGDIILSDIKSMMTELTNEPDYSPKYDTINDFSDSNILVNEDNIEDYIRFLKRLQYSIDKRKIAFITNKPKQVVLTYLFSVKIKKLSISADMFSTTEAVINYLSNPKISEVVLENIISDMKKQLKNV